MSNNLNTVTEQIGAVERAAATMGTLSAYIADAAYQVRMRHRHLESVITHLVDGDYKNTEGQINVALLADELVTIRDRCPDLKDLPTYREHAGDAHRLLGKEITELYEQVEKMRELQAALTTDTPTL